MKTLEQRFRQFEGNDLNKHAGSAEKNGWEGLIGISIAVLAFIFAVSFFSTSSQAGFNRVIVCKSQADVNRLVDLQADDKKAATAFAYKLGRQSRCTLMRIMFPTTDYVDSLAYYRKVGNTIYGTAHVKLKSGGNVYAMIVAHVDASTSKKVDV